MLLTPRKLAFLGLLLAFDVLLIILSGVFEFNTLFLLAAASFCVGIAIRESGKRMGFAFYLAGLLLGLILAPNKMYCITYAAMGLYILIFEFAQDKLMYVKNMGNRLKLLWAVKFIAFNLMFIPLLIISPQLIYSGKLNMLLYVILFIGGQVAFYIYDLAYIYFQGMVWGRMRRMFKL